MTKPCGFWVLLFFNSHSQVKLYSDDVCDSKRIFENVTAAAIPLDSCEKDKSGVAVYYQCTGSNKLHIRVYFRGSCAENPPTIEADPINGKCVPLPGFGSGFWTWEGGCWAKRSIRSACGCGDISSSEQILTLEPGHPGCWACCWALQEVYTSTKENEIERA